MQMNASSTILNMNMMASIDNGFNIKKAGENFKSTAQASHQRTIHPSFSSVGTKHTGVGSKTMRVSVKKGHFPGQKSALTS